MDLRKLENKNTFRQTHYTAILVDDAESARELLRLMLNELAPHVNIIGEAENVMQAVELIGKTKPDIVFLDINMPGKSGLDLFGELDMAQVGCEVIFTTAYNEYAIQAFKLSAIDYLLKPIQEKELLQALARAIEAKELKQNAKKFKALLNNLEQKNTGILTIPLNYGYEYIVIDNIEFIEAHRSYSIIHLIDGSEKMVSKPMGYFEEVLQHINHFIKVHRSYFVNILHISSFLKKGETGVVSFKSGKCAEVSRNHRKDCIEKIEALGNNTII